MLDRGHALGSIYIVVQCTVAGQVRSGQASDVTGHAASGR